MLLSQARKNFPNEVCEEHKDDDQAEKDSTKDSTAETPKDGDAATAALGIVGLFDNMEADANACRAVAEVLFSYKHYAPAIETCGSSLELCTADDCTMRFKALALRATIESKMGNYKVAYATIAECLLFLDDVSVPASVKRSGLMTKAKIEAKLKHWDASADAYAQARLVDPSGLTPGNALVRELAPFDEKDDYDGYIRTLKSWTPIERLTWMAWDYSEAGSSRHANLRRIARVMDAGPFLIDVYTEALIYLDRLNAGAPMRINLAMAYLEVTGELALARKTLQDVLGSFSNGWHYGITDESSFLTLLKAINCMPQVLEELFTATCDPDAKEELYKELKGLMKTRLATDVSIFRNIFATSRRLSMIKMCLKMGTAREFQRRLQRVLDDCFAGLRDVVDWNDQPTMDILGHSLIILLRAAPSSKDLMWYARVILSAQFSRVTAVAPQNDASTEKADEDSDDELAPYLRYRKESAPPAEDEDLLDPDAAVQDCESGVCHPTTQWTHWRDQGAYYCTICWSALICEICYAEMMSKDTKWKFYTCGKSHSFVKLPIEGWRGIKDGMVRIDGREPIAFTEMLSTLQNDVCKQAWEVFWSGC